MKKLLENKKLFRLLSIIPITILYLILFYGIFISIVRSFGIYDAIGLNKFTMIIYKKAYGRKKRPPQSSDP